VSARDVVPGGAHRERYEPYNPQRAADRRINWEQALNTGREFPEPERWDGVSR